MIAFFKERLPGGGQGEEVQALQGGAGQAQEVWQELQPSLAPQVNFYTSSHNPHILPSSEKKGHHISSTTFHFIYSTMVDRTNELL